jgi:hypothetical protein
MKQLSKTPCPLLLMAFILIIFSCTKNEPFKASESTQLLSSQASDAIAADVDSIVGRYRITSYAEDGKNETSRFKGYRFNFQADSDFVARTSSGQTVEGTWLLDSTGTKLTINISGTGSLNRLVGEWKIANLTSTRLVLTNKDGDRVVFTRLIN